MFFPLDSLLFYSPDEKYSKSHLFSSDLLGQCSIDSGLKYFLFKNILKLFFLFLKNIFNINTSKRYKNIKKIHFKQKKIKILRKRFLPSTKHTLKKRKRKKKVMTSSSMSFDLRMGKNNIVVK